MLPLGMTTFKLEKRMCVWNHTNLLHINASEEEKEECIRKIRKWKIGYLFENAEKMDIQAERRKTAEALQRLQENRAEGENVLERVASQYIEWICCKY